MNISIAVTSDDEHKVHKNLSVLGSYTGTLKDDCSMENPTVLVQVPEGTVQQANYAAMSAGGELPRTYYYFIKDKVMHRSGVVELTMECDYLMTFENEIKNLVCTVDRTETQEVTNAFLVDNEYQILACENIVTKIFPVGFEDESIVLLTVG